ncbi:MAG: Gfo/Idh/MocA family oxidoreductase, partial [Chthoniobacterales bacterium]|nr:Gfo/Idh/MocA family oxidoreductase [Chthoniobacterales bacterium]
MQFGLIGAGCIGQLRVQSLQKISGAKLVAVTDVDRQRTATLADGASARACRDIGELLEVPAVEAVIVSTPPQFHEEAVLMALGAGKHVLCEKPLSNSSASAARMVVAARDAGRMLTTGFNHRYFPNIRFLKKTIEDGTIGKLDHVRAFAGHEGLSQFRAPWEYDRNVIGGGALMDVGIHMIDLTAYVLGDVAEVFGVATNRVLNLPGSEDNGFALLRSADGTVATLHATWSEWKGYRFFIEAYGDQGMVRAFYAPMMNMVITKSTGDGKSRRRRIFYPMNMLKEKFLGWQSTAIETFRLELSDFISL